MTARSVVKPSLLLTRPLAKAFSAAEPRGPMIRSICATSLPSPTSNSPTLVLALLDVKPDDGFGKSAPSIFSKNEAIIPSLPVRSRPCGVFDFARAECPYCWLRPPSGKTKFLLAAAPARQTLELCRRHRFAASMLGRLSGGVGRLRARRRGAVRLPAAHVPTRFSSARRGAWLRCAWRRLPKPSARP